MLEEVITKATNIAKDTLSAEASQCDKKAQWVKQTMIALAREKLTALVVPAHMEGLGQGAYAVTRVCEELGKVYASAGITFGMHCTAAAVLSTKTSAYIRDHFVIPIAEGQHICSFAFSEVSTGTHLFFPQSVAKKQDSFISLHGLKSFVTNAGYADSYVLTAAAKNGSENSGSKNSFYVVEASAVGIEWNGEWDGLGMRGCALRDLKLNNVKVSEQHILGNEGDLFWFMFNVVLPIYLSAVSGTFLGLAQSAFNEARDIVKKRYYIHSGSYLAHNTVLQNKLGHLWSELETTKRLVYNASSASDKGEAGALMLVLAAKARVAECAVHVVNESLSLIGGNGYKANSSMCMLLRDAKAADIMSPCTAELYTWIGRSVLDQPVFSE